MDRRSFLITASVTTAVTVLYSCTTQKQNPQPTSSSSSNQKKQVNIVFDKFGPLAVIRKKKTLEQAVVSKGYSIQWKEFAAGPQQLEALNAGSLDLARTAESPVIFAQAAGADLVYLATTIPISNGVAFLVPNDSPIKSFADFKGKRIAFQKASIANYILIKALKQAGLKLSDITPVYLPPPDANVAFSQAKVDVWVIWEPFIGRVEQQKIGRVLRYGEELIDVGLFYSASRKFAEENPEFIKIYLEEVQKAKEWATENPRQFAELLSEETGIEVDTLEKIASRQKYSLRPITNEVIATQQKVADMYYDLGLLPKKIDPSEVVLSPEYYAKVTPKTVIAKP
ncbi:aliphatic sulfonate ABC transporter substrate-binding protein [Dendronalium sp. ChiSLP03b]|uniref:aliphatic sulfonate ABC transporter substrate-binding protein n=1 Tax=Dendronalium sp. ChiSLP03b TaxID=3075381 RepID=UPI002AD4B326|nr:aliphatic sulfonate ABC transporter substrate-binding protein [Dendronalium sp. ChiSLP03b]MDZ8208725.1 aliphatic sulfonate ABC transporter substrate-binding protein [Dendronalium sp. ChiSLP03b]